MRLALPNLLPLYSISSGLIVLNQYFLDGFFFSRPSLPLFPYPAHNPPRASCASLPLFRTPRSCPSPPAPGLWSSACCDGLAGASDLEGLGLLVGVVPPLASMCVCIYLMAHNRAIQPCHPSYSTPLLKAVILPRGGGGGDH